MSDVREDVMNICSALGIDLRGLADDTLEVIGLRIVAEEVLPTKPAIQRIVDDMRAGGGQAKTVDSPESTAVEEPALPAPSKGYRFNSTEATEAKYRQRLARAHRTEDSRTGLYLVPRRREIMPTSAVHPACWAAYNDKGQPCGVCTPRLHPDECMCEVCERFWMEVDG